MLISGDNHIRLITGHIIYLEDGDKTLIAECVEDVVADLKKLMPLENKRIIYRDRFGDFDEIVIKDGQFSRFLRVESNDPDLVLIREIWSYYAP